MHPSSRGSHSNLEPCDDLNTSFIDEDYIDMEVHSTTFLCYSINSSPDFEFNMSVQEKDSLTSPADELFYKGKLLPLHLPPRIQMVRKLLHSCDQEKTSPLSSQGATPYESCSVTPFQFCQVSGELNSDEYFHDCTMNLGSTADGADVTSSSSCAKKAWCKKLKLIKQLAFGGKLKASKAYLRSLFGKSGCSEGQCTAAVKNNSKCRKESLFRVDTSAEKAMKDCLKNKCTKVTKRNPFEEMQRESRKAPIKEDAGHRKSFSGAIKALSFSGVNSLSSPSLLSLTGETDGYNGLHLLKRSSSVNSDVERSIQGAIAYCKQTQLLCPRRSASEVGFFSLTAASRVAASETKERPGLCRG
ncbi:probable membrane-associated kinase regulator 4 [Nymphaea colorata]|uniref:Membrane-associated kinase regulator 4 n=1 Tax=Nymphaea colorata TaxID=210225 RepID=A0A5K1D766_9MAGN|nr:probable membrane-associated kinase regulator 4 [Nymphaea colorata]